MPTALEIIRSMGVHGGKVCGAYCPGPDEVKEAHVEVHDEQDQPLVCADETSEPPRCKPPGILNASDRARRLSEAAQARGVPLRVRIRGCDVIGLDFTFHLEVAGADDRLWFSVRRARADLEHIDRTLKQHFPANTLDEILKIFPTTMPSMTAAVHQWVGGMNAARAPLQHQALQSFFGVLGPSGLWASPGRAGLAVIAERFQPLLSNIAGFLADSPSDLVRFCSWTARSLREELKPTLDSVWGGMYRRKWPALHACVLQQGVDDWCRLYQETHAGQCESVLEVFEREKKPGFAMSAMPARVRYDSAQDCYTVRYFNTRESQAETIPLSEEHRLRYCPHSACEKLQPAPPKSEDAPAAAAAYPYRVLDGADGLVVGQGIELQWKMQLKSPFGWWYGKLEALQHDEKGGHATATITFDHFPKDSQWHRLEVRFGDSEMRRSAFGGFTGGVRAASATDQQQWMRFFPKQPVAL